MPHLHHRLRFLLEPLPPRFGVLRERLIGLANQAAHAAASGRLEPAREAERDAHLALLQLGATDWDECLTHIAESGPEIDAFVGAIG